jgi:phospholipid/cholesterol/gamma-HCH transport system ATP-binding protein
MINLEHVDLRLNGDAILHNLSMKLSPGEIVGLVGPTCGGKSVLLKLLAGIFKPTSGTCHRDKDVSVSLMFQEGALFDSCTVFDNVCFPIVNGNVPTWLLPRGAQDEMSKSASYFLRRVGLDWAAHKMPNELSGGMKRRVSLARALVNRPQVALLDDPTCGLDPVASSVIMDLIVELQRELGSSMILASHDLRRLLPRCDRILCLWDGQVEFSGTVQELAKSAPPYVRHFLECRYEFT